MPQFLLQPEDIDETSRTATVRGEEAHHLARVFRVREGERVLLFDGAGSRWEGTVARAAAEEVQVNGLSLLPSGEPGRDLWLLPSLVKGERWEWLLEKAVELGATRILPLLAGHGVARPGDRAETKLSRWRKCLLAAAKQCERGCIPRIDPPLPVNDLVGNLPSLPAGESRFLLAARGSSTALRIPLGASRVLLAVGPEGGWTEGEEQAFLATGFSAASLGPRILRSETAALAALALAQCSPGAGDRN
jgi:16S rRNA (uracil1498-N3)-methyltransferase